MPSVKLSTKSKAMNQYHPHTNRDFDKDNEQPPSSKDSKVGQLFLPLYTIGAGDVPWSLKCVQDLVVNIVSKLLWHF